MGRGAVTKSQKGKKVSVERTVAACNQWKAVVQCSQGGSCSFRHDPVSGNRGDHRQKGQSSSLAPKAKAQTNGKIPSKKFKQQRRDSVWNKRQDSVPKFPSGTVQTKKTRKKAFPPVPAVLAYLAFLAFWLSFSFCQIQRMMQHIEKPKEGKTLEKRDEQLKDRSLGNRKEFRCSQKIVRMAASCLQKECGT